MTNTIEKKTLTVDTFSKNKLYLDQSLGPRFNAPVSCKSIYNIFPDVTEFHCDGMVSDGVFGEKMGGGGNGRGNVGSDLT